MQYRKLTTLRSLGWTRKEMLELFDEMLDIIFEEKNQKMITSKEQIVRETLEELGFLLEMMARSICRTLFCTIWRTERQRCLYVEVSIWS